MNTENKTQQPLYKVLNEKRTKGEWIPDERNNKIHIEAIGKDMEEKTAVEVAVMHGNEAIDRIDAQYTALAVNNLHHLADLLEECKSDYTGYWDADDKESGTYKMIVKITEALKKIS